MGAHVAKRKGWSFPSAGATYSAQGTYNADDRNRQDGKRKSWWERHIVYLVVLAMVLAWALSTRLRQYVYDREGLEPNKVLSIKTRCQELRGGLGPDDVSGCNHQVTRLLGYCHENVGLVSGDEGVQVESNGDNFELVHLLLTVRHGDRSAIHTMPHALGSEEAEAAGARPLMPWQYSKDGLNHPVHGNEFLDLRALHYVPSLTKFDLRAVEERDIAEELHTSEHKHEVKDGENEMLEHQELPPVRPLPPALEPKNVFQTPDFDLPPGQLTSRGFMQEYNLGSYLKRRYEGFLERHVQHPVHAYVRTTNYPRTIQSVAGLILGLLPEVGGPDHRIPLWSHLSETSEVMHGIGLRLSSKGVSSNSPGDKEIAGGCPKSVSMAKQQKRSYELGQDVHGRIDSLFGEKASSRFVTDLADASLPPLCHNRPLPCSIDDSKGCLTEPDLGELMAEADRAFCARYTGSSGGDIATKLSIYPFLEEIMGALRGAAESDALWFKHDMGVARRKRAAEEKGNVYEPSYEDDILVLKQPDPGKPGETREVQLRRDERRAMHVFMGHDTVIAPVLAGLGLYKGDLCGWPPYASRISFELLKPSSTDSGDASETPFKYHVRIIYNGRDLTSLAEKCAGSSPCPLEKIEETVLDLIKPSSSLEEACRE